jgi:anti-sigma factor RsiW
MSDAHSAVGSYVADALSPIERAEFENHLAGCYKCRLEVAEYSETVAMLTPLVATSPPASLRASVLAAIGAGQSFAPELVARAEEHADIMVEPDPTVVRPKTPATVTELRPLGPDEVTPLDEHPSVLPDSSWVGVAASLSDDLGVRRNRRTDRILVALVAAALVVALIFSGWVYVSWQQGQAQESVTQQETDLLTAPDAKIYASTVNGTPVSYVVSKERNEAMFIASKLDDPGTNSTYQLWIFNGNTATSAGVIQEGGAVRKLIRPAGPFDRLAITREPRSEGSPNPTLPALFEISLP